MGKGSIAQWLAYLLLDPTSLGSIPEIPQKIQSKKLSMLLRLINGAAWGKLDSDLKMLIEPI